MQQATRRPNAIKRLWTMLIIFCIGAICVITAAMFTYGPFTSIGYEKGKNEAIKNIAASNNVALSKANQQIELLQSQLVEEENKFIPFNFTEEDLQIVLRQTYTFLTIQQTKELINAIKSTAHKYNIEPLILYSICATESSFRWWLTHTKIRVKDWKGNFVNTHAIGLGGIVYEIWEPKLKQAGILTAKRDLYDPVINIDAIGFIYSEYRKMPLLPGSEHITQSALIRYLGGNYKNYFKKIDAIIIDLFRSKLYKLTKDN